MTLCLAQIFNFKQQYPGQLSEIARMGSGSATRSLEGGAVEWIGGEDEVRNREWDQVKREEIEEKTKEELSKKCVARQVRFFVFSIIYLSTIKDLRISLANWQPYYFFHYASSFFLILL